MGSAFAARLRERGFAVQGFDIDRTRMAAFAELGGAAAASPGEVLQRCDRVIHVADGRITDDAPAMAAAS